MVTEHRSLQTTPEVLAHRHDVFICYCEADDRFATRLAKFLKNYNPPPKLHHRPLGKLKVFKDANGLNGTEFGQYIERELLRSRKMIVICSPKARKSQDVNDKILRFAERNGADNIIPVIVEGIPNDQAGPEDENNLAFPEALYQVMNQPRGNNYSGFNLFKDKFHKGAYEGEWYTLLANLYDANRVEIAQLDRDRRFQQKRRRILALIGALLLAGAIWGALAWKRQSEQEARQQMWRGATAQHFWERSRLARAENDLLLSLHLAAEAIDLTSDRELRETILQETVEIQPAARLEFVLQHTGKVAGARFNRDRSLALTWSDDSTARLWNVATGQEVFSPLKHENWVYGAVFTRDENRLLTWSADGAARFWSAKDGQLLSPLLRLASGVIGAILNRDESRLLTWHDDFSAQLWDLATGAPLGARARHDGWINGAGFNSDEREFLTWSDDSTAQRWDARTGEPLGAPLRHKGAINGLIFSSDFTRFLTWSADSTARLWAAHSGKPAGPVLRHGAEVIGACFDRAETRLLTWSRDNTARLWDARTGREAIPPLRHNGWVLGAAFDRDENRIITWSQDNTARLWDAATGQPLTPPLPHSSGPLRNDAGVFGAALNETGMVILTWGDDNTARLWGAAAGRQIGPPLQHDNRDGHNHEVEGAIVSPDFSAILTWSTDNTARLWKTGGFASIPAMNGEAGVDADFPAEAFKLQVMALTGTELDSLRGVAALCLEPQRWQQLNIEYARIAREHYRECRYPQYNLWARLNPYEAGKLP